MRRSALVGLAAVVFLTSCGTVRESRLNPFNWFDRSTETTLEPTGGWRRTVDNRPLVDQVIELSVHAVSGGAMVQAIGLPPTQGWWDAELLGEGGEVRAEGGVLRLNFVILPPRRTQRTGTPVSREVSAGLFVPNARLDGVRQIIVSGATNARTVSRR